MNIGAILKSTPVATYPRMTSASSSPLQSSSHQPLPSIVHVTSGLSQRQQQQLHSSHNSHQHVQTMPQSMSSLPPPPRQVLSPRVDSASSLNSSIQSSSPEHSPQPSLSSVPHHPRKNTTVRRDSSASSRLTNLQQRRRPGGQTKAACLPCRKRKSKCDGVRPSCKCCTSKSTICSYTVTTPGLTQQQAVKNELDAYKRVLKLIRESSLADAHAFVQIIKESDSLDVAVQDIQAMTTRQHHSGGV